MTRGRLISFCIFLQCLSTTGSFAQHKSPYGPWVPDQGDGTYKNPIIFADYSDPDVIRVGDDFYMTSSSFQCTPVLPILHSRDLVNWKIIGHVSEQMPSPIFNRPQHGKGCWAPSLRYHDSEFYVYYGDPDLGIFMSKTKNPAGRWEPLICVKQTRGWIDPCPFWDDDGKAYLVHAWAKSRVGFNSVLHVNSMSADGKHILDDSVLVFDGHAHHPTIEGPKLYKRNGFYYIFSPAGGVPGGWQTVLRSQRVLGPYEDRVVLHQGKTQINGPHQGGWVETQSGESWFIHFQDRGAYGRIIHLQPMWWKNDWPVIGILQDSTGCAEPVLTWKKPNVGKNYPIEIPQSSDEFDSPSLGLQWQWHANHTNQWYSLTEKKGALRLRSVAKPSDGTNLWDVPHLLLQKWPAEHFTVTTSVSPHLMAVGEIAGLLVMGLDYSFVGIERKRDGLSLVKRSSLQADKGTAEVEETAIPLKGSSSILRVEVKAGAVCEFSYSENGKEFHAVGRPFIAREGRWIGAKIGVFSVGHGGNTTSGFADFDWFRVE